MMTVEGYDSFGRFGEAVATLGDITGDNFPELLVGAPRADATPMAQSWGRFYVIAGNHIGPLSQLGQGFAPTAPVGQDIIVTEPATQANDRLGHSVAVIGDVDGGGTVDFAVGMPGDDAMGQNVGSVRVYSGEWVAAVAAGGGAASGLMYIVNGAAPNDEFGVSLSGGVDANGDGTPDFAAGSRLEDDGFIPNTGSARILNGPDGSLLELTYGTINSSYGHAVLLTHADPAFDRYGELVVGAPGYTPPGQMAAGRVRGFRGGPFLGPCAAGNVPGLVANVLTINGSFGGVERRVEVSNGGSVVFGMAQPTTFSNSGWVLLASPLVPAQTATFAAPSGPACFDLALLGTPALIILANSFVPSSGFLPATPAPWQTLVIAPPVGAFRLFLQGVIVTGSGVSNNVATTNGLILDIG